MGVPPVVVLVAVARLWCLSVLHVISSDWSFLEDPSRPQHCPAAERCGAWPWLLQVIKHRLVSEHASCTAGNVCIHSLPHSRQPRSYRPCSLPQGGADAFLILSIN
jgi:hypothetical protein